MTTTAIERYEAPSEATTVYEPRDSRDAYEMAGRLVKSGLLPNGIQTAEAAFAIIVTGKELGLTVMQSLRSVHVIKGKPTLSADLILALAKRSPVCTYFQLIKSNDKVAAYRTQRVGEEPTEMGFTIEQAQRAGLLSNDNWKKYPEAMLRARCIAALARAVYPDVVLGIYETSELDSIDEPAPRQSSVRQVLDAVPVVPVVENPEVVALLRSVFATARNPADLEEAVKQTRKAKSEGHISDATNKELASFYKQRKAEIAATIAKASEPEAEGTEAAQ